MAYIGSSPTKVVSRQSANIFTYTATANQTAFTGADANGNTLACTPSDIMVHMNGIKLEESDYTASITTVTLGSGAAAGDEVTITAFLTFESADHYTKSAADTRYVNTAGDTMTGALTVGGAVTVNNNHVNIDSGYSYQWGDSHERIEQSDGKIEFFTNNSEQMVLSGGILLTPNQPSFAAYVSSNHTGYDANTVGNSYVIYNTELYDIGNNHSNGLFTAPVAGVYYFRAEAYTSVYCTQSWFIVNGYRTNASDTVYAGDDEFSGNSTILKLAANDTVGFHPYRSGYNSITVNANSSHSWFRGILLG